MKTNIKIFTVLILTLTTMPALATTCPYDEINEKTVPGVHPKCDCSDTGGKDAVPATSLGFTKKTHFISYNYQADKGINQCDEWIYLDAPCVHKGHSPSPKDYQTANIQQKGNCLVFGKQHKRKRIRELVAEYNKIYDKGNGSIQAGDKILIADTKTVSNPVDLVDEWTAINNYQKKSGQPSIRGILWGYNKLCEKNGLGFELVRSNENSAVYYVCKGETAPQPTPISQQKTSTINTTKPAADTSHLTSTTSSSDKGSTSSGNTSTYTVSVKGVDYPVISPATNTRQKIESIVNRYNNTYSISPTDEFDFSDMYKVFFGTKQSEPSIIAVNDGYKAMCKDLADKHIGGIASTHWLDVTTSGALVQKRKCIVDGCVSTHEKISGQCHEKNNQVHSNDQGSANGTNIQQVVQTIQSTPAQIGNTITYPKTDAKNTDVKKEIKNWKEKCKEAVKKALGSISVESDYIKADYDSATNSLKCRIKKCADPTNTHLADDKKSCVPNEDKSQQSRSATTNAGATTTTTTTPPQTNVQTTVTQEEVKGSGSGQQDPTISVGEEIINTQKTDEEACRFEGGTWNGTTCVCEDPTTEEWDPVNKICIAKQTDPVISVETDVLETEKNTQPAGSWMAQPGSDDEPKSKRQQQIEQNYNNSLSVEASRQNACEKLGGRWVTKGKTSTCVCPNQAQGEFWDSEKLTCVVEDYEREDEPHQGFDIEEETEELEKKSKKQSEALPLPKPEEPKQPERSKTNTDDTIQPLQENICDDQKVEHIIEEMATPRQDPNGNPYIEYPINYKTCDNLQQTWSEKCPDGTKSSITEDGNNIKLTCVPKDDSEVKKNNVSDFDAIVKAFEEKAKQLKAKNCGQQQ